MGVHLFVPGLYGASLGTQDQASDAFHYVAAFYSESCKIWWLSFCSGF